MYSVDRLDIFLPKRIQQVFKRVIMTFAGNRNAIGARTRINLFKRCLARAYVTEYFYLYLNTSECPPDLCD